MPFWNQINTDVLAQGDYLPDCSVPIIRSDFDAANLRRGVDVVEPIEIIDVDLIIMTQSCDLENGKAPWVACCPISTLSQFELQNAAFNSRRWEEVRRGRIEGLHLLAGFSQPNDNRQALVVNFRQIFSLPVGYLITRTTQLGNRWRLDSPYLEHFSQAFARFFMRVGLPSAIPSFT